MKIKNSINLLLLSGLIASCVSRVGTADKTFDAPGSFSSIVSKEQDNSKSENQAGQEQENQEPKAPAPELEKALTEKERIQKLKEDYFKKFADTESFDLQCNSTGCTSITEETFPKGPSVIRTDYIVDKDSIKPFKPDATLSGTTTYKADTIVKTRYGYNPSPIKNHKGTMELNIDNKTGWGNAKTSIKNISGYDDVKDIDIEYKNIDYTNDNFNSSDVKLINGSTGKKFQSYEAWNISGNINGNLSGESNSTGNFNIKADILKTPFELKGIFSGKEKTVDKNGYIDCGAPKCP